VRPEGDRERERERERDERQQTVESLQWGRGTKTEQGNGRRAKGVI
jgi:hypothetical protein